MNREILFRGRRFKGSGFTYGSLVVDNVNKQHFISSNHVYQNDIDVACTNVYKVIPETVGQFTGLTDKNGVKIFEGDLLSDPFPIDEEDLSKGYYESFLPVVWCSKTLQWCVDASFAKDSSFLTSLVEYFGEFLEVKGNIYENPELIK